MKVSLETIDEHDTIDTPLVNKSRRGILDTPTKPSITVDTVWETDTESIPDLDMTPKPRRRLRRSSVSSYTEPKLNSKLRKGDSYTSGNETPVVKKEPSVKSVSVTTRKPSTRKRVPFI